jgi:hypothetical protein
MPEVTKVCLRWLRFGVCVSKVAVVYPRYIRGDNGVFEMPETFGRQLK